MGSMFTLSSPADCHGLRPWGPLALSSRERSDATAKAAWTSISLKPAIPWTVCHPPPGRLDIGFGGSSRVAGGVLQEGTIFCWSTVSPLVCLSRASHPFPSVDLNITQTAHVLIPRDSAQVRSALRPPNFPTTRSQRRRPPTPPTWSISAPVPCPGEGRGAEHGLGLCGLTWAGVVVGASLGLVHLVP